MSPGHHLQFVWYFPWLGCCPVVISSCLLRILVAAEPRAHAPRSNCGALLSAHLSAHRVPDHHMPYLCVRAQMYASVLIPDTAVTPAILKIICAQARSSRLARAVLPHNIGCSTPSTVRGGKEAGFGGSSRCPLASAKVACTPYISICCEVRLWHLSAAVSDAVTSVQGAK